jgi:hypothetical protein
LSKKFFPRYLNQQFRAKLEIERLRKRGLQNSAYLGRQQGDQASLWKIAQSVAQPKFYSQLIRTFCRRKSGYRSEGSFVILKKLAKVSNLPIGGRSPNLVALAGGLFLRMWQARFNVVSPSWFWHYQDTERIVSTAGMFTHSFTPRGEHSLLFRRMMGRTENFTPQGDDFVPGGKVRP